MKRYTKHWFDDELEEDTNGELVYYMDHLEVVSDLNRKIKLLVDHIEFMEEKFEELKKIL